MSFIIKLNNCSSKNNNITNHRQQSPQQPQESIDCHDPYHNTFYSHHNSSDDYSSEVEQRGEYDYYYSIKNSDSAA